MVRTKYYTTGDQMGDKFRHVVPKPSEFSAEDVAFTVNGEEGNELKEYFPIYFRPSLIGEFTTRDGDGSTGRENFGHFMRYTLGYVLTRA